ncbi:hypothetical protein A3Q56_02292, partial [Intoshia linei]
MNKLTENDKKDLIFYIGGYYNINHNGEVHKCKIADIRKISDLNSSKILINQNDSNVSQCDVISDDSNIDKKKKRDKDKPIIVKYAQSEEYEFFVHFLYQNHRWDTWINQESFKSSARPGRLKKSASTGYNKMFYSEAVDDNGEFDEDKYQNLKTLSLNYDEKVNESAVTSSKNVRSKLIEQIQIGGHLIETWYFSPYPDPFGESKLLYICEFCLRYMSDEDTFVCHCQTSVDCYKPPGNEIYRSEKISVFEVNATYHQRFCQSLCLLAKLFLNEKSIYFDIGAFLFYVLTEKDSEGFYHFIGFFSKEKVSFQNFNLSCIMVLPSFQRRGFGKFLISFSYELSRIEQKIGSPEKPLSDLGALGYESFWLWKIINFLSSEIDGYYSYLIKNSTYNGDECKAIAIYSNLKTVKREQIKIVNFTFDLETISKATWVHLIDVCGLLKKYNMLIHWKGSDYVCVNKDYLQK